MTASLSLENLLAWMLQVLVFASLAAVLPLIFRIRHPRTHLAYCHLALIVCLLLPLLQRWSHPVIVTGHQTPTAFQPPPAAILDQPPARAPIPWDRTVLWILAAGAGARLC